MVRQLITGAVLTACLTVNPGQANDLIEDGKQSSTTGAANVSLQPKLRACSENLRMVTGFDGSNTGLYPSKSSNYQAYEQCFIEGANIRSDLLWLADNASPAGRLYAAVLLRRVDPLVGERTLQAMQTDTTVVLENLIGGVTVQSTIAQVSAELLKDPETLRLNYRSTRIGCGNYHKQLMTLPFICWLYADDPVFATLSMVPFWRNRGLIGVRLSTWRDIQRHRQILSAGPRQGIDCCSRRAHEFVFSTIYGNRIPIGGGYPLVHGRS